MFFKSPKEVTERYEGFLKGVIGKVNEIQYSIKNILEGKDRSNATIEGVLIAATSLIGDLIKSVAGYLRQAERTQMDYQYLKADYKRLENSLLPKYNTYCCVTKEPIPSRKEDIKKAGLKEGDLQILFRLIPCVWFNSGVLENPDNGIPFITIADVADYLGENPSSDGKVAKAMQRLIKAGIVWRYGGLFIMNDYYIRCGAMTGGVMKNRHIIFEKYKKQQGKKQAHKQGKIMDMKNVKIDIVKEPQTQSTSGQGIFEEIPF
jgi:hypothetical protein